MSKAYKDVQASLQRHQNELEGVASLFSTVPENIAKLSQEIMFVRSAIANTPADIHDIFLGVQALHSEMDSKCATLCKAKFIDSICVEKTRDSILQWISPLEPSKRHQDIRSLRLDETCKWILQAPEFVNWNSDASPNRALYCSGIPGAGKTITTYVEQLNCIFQANPT